MFARLMFGAALLLCAAGPAMAQSYPSKPIRLVVGFAPGGSTDSVARTVAVALSRALGQPVVVENRPGAGSSIAAEQVSKSPPDGYTVLVSPPSGYSVNPALNPKLTYRGNLQAVTIIGTSPMVLAVNPTTGIASVKDLIAAAKKAPESLNYASSGNGSAPHLGAALFIQLTGARMTHVPFKGGAQAVQSVVAGDTQVTFATPPTVLGLIQAGRLRALAVTSRERSPLIPDLPGMAEAGLPEYHMSFWYGFFVPVGTPPDVVKRLFDATVASVQQPEVKTVLVREGTEVVVSRSPEHFSAFLAEDTKFWERLVKEAGVTID
jgi:tripartite-type tricarboxylate transporter receptor subunit TctC